MQKRDLIQANASLENLRQNLDMKDFAKEILLEENYNKFIRSYKFQFIKSSACPAVSFTAGQALSYYTVCFPGARVSLRPSGRVTSAVKLAGISNS